MFADFISPADLAAGLGVSKDTIRRWVRQRKLPAPVVLGHKTRRFRASEVAAYLDRQSTRPTSSS
jgi:excisionase family DNA binding protein